MTTVILPAVAAAILSLLPGIYWIRRASRNRRIAENLVRQMPTGPLPNIYPKLAVFRISNWRSSAVHSNLTADGCFSLLRSTVHGCLGFRWAWSNPLGPEKVFYGMARQSWFGDRRVIFIYSCIAFTGTGGVKLSVQPTANGSTVTTSLEWGTVSVGVLFVPFAAIFLTAVGSISGIGTALSLSPFIVVGAVRMLFLISQSVRLRMATASLIASLLKTAENANAR